MRTVSISNAEKCEAGWRTITVPPGTRVSLGGGWIAIVSQAAINCDCGKGVYCSYNTQVRVGGE